MANILHYYLLEGEVMRKVEDKIDLEQKIMLIITAKIGIIELAISLVVFHVCRLRITNRTMLILDMSNRQTRNPSNPGSRYYFFMH